MKKEFKDMNSDEENEDLAQKANEDLEVDIDHLKDFVEDLTEAQLNALQEIIHAKNSINRAAWELNEKDDEDSDKPVSLAMIERKMK